MNKCRICGAPIAPFMSFGKMPIANGFLFPHQYGQEYFFELAPAFCPQCNMVQLIEQPEPEQMFHGEYAYFASTSAYMCEHFRQLYSRVTKDFLGDDPFVVEIGSNDGISLRNYAAAGIRHLGIEPSANVAERARSLGVQTWCEFFDDKLAHRIVAEHGKADVFMGANVMCHIPSLSSVFKGVRELLKPTGVMIFEDPYLGDVIEKTSFDQLYDEHVFLFSAQSIANAARPHGLELIDLEHLDTHGGSMRYFLAPTGARQPAPIVAQTLENERRLGLDKPETFDSFRRSCEAIRDDLRAVLDRLRAEGKRVVGYGATSKSTTVINYCGISPDHLEFISDTTPTKQGKFTPGGHIPVKPRDAFAERYPDYALLFAWNHAAEIQAKETDFNAKGGRWITYVPKVEISQ